MTNQLNMLIRVRYGECDAQQVVFNARYADYADIAATEFMRVLIGKYQYLIDAGFDNQVVSLHIDWFASAKFDDVLQLQVKIEHVGRTSYRLKTTCTKLDGNGNNIAIANMYTTYVVVDTKNFKKAPIPDILLQNFSRTFDVTVDQSGIAT